MPENIATIEHRKEKEKEREDTEPNLHLNMISDFSTQVS